MDLQAAALKNNRLLLAARVAAVICFAVAGVMLIASLKVGHSGDTSARTKSVARTFTQASVTL